MLRYRPQDPEDLDWQDNCVSNALAWASDHVTPTFCENEKHWTVRVSNYMWTSCPCCLFFRGVIVGASATILLIAILAAAIYAL